MSLDPQKLSNQQKAILFGLFLSKYDKKKALDCLGFDTYTQAYVCIGQKLGVSPSAIQIHRNKFDTFFPNNRRGFQRNLRKGDLQRYEKWIKDTRELSFEDLRSILISILENQEIREDNKNNSIIITQEFERLSKAFDKAFERMLTDCDNYLLKNISLLRTASDNDSNFDDTDNDNLKLIEDLLSGYDEVFKLNEEQHFKHYKAIALKLYDFIQTNWDKYYRLHKDYEVPYRYYSNYYTYVRNYNDEIRNKIQGLKCEAPDIFSSYLIIDKNKDCFALNCAEGNYYDLEHYLLERGCEALKNPHLIFQEHDLWLFEIIHFLLHPKHKKDFAYILFKNIQSSHPTKQNIIFDTPSDEIKKGALYAELAYHLYDTKDSKKRLGSVKPYNLQIPNCQNINGTFELPCKLMGYIAQSEKDNLILCFKGTKLTCGRNWTTNRLQLFKGPEIAYLCALGLLLILRNQTSQMINVYGHSLGGGLSQFAVAVAVARNENNIFAYAFNSAGLGETSLEVINSINPSIDFSKIQHLFHRSDCVHACGSHVGICYYFGEKVSKTKKILNGVHYHEIDTIISYLNLSPLFELNKKH